MGYHLFTVYERPRVEPEPSWGVRVVSAGSSLNGQERQMVKDRAMAASADWGLAVFDPIQKNRHGALQVSSGTLRNAVQMLLEGKQVKFFHLFEGKMRARNLKTLEDLETLIESYGGEQLSHAKEEMIHSARGVAADEDAAHVKCGKIRAKYRSLLKKERALLPDGGESAASPAGFSQGALPLS